MRLDTAVFVMPHVLDVREAQRLRKSLPMPGVIIKDSER